MSDCFLALSHHFQCQLAGFSCPNECIFCFSVLRTGTLKVSQQPADSLTEKCYILGISSMTVQQGSCWKPKHVHSCSVTLITTSSYDSSMGWS